MEGLTQSAVLAVIILSTIWIHYAFLDQLNRQMLSLRAGPRVRIMGGVAVAIIAHVIEVGVFAFGYYLFAEIIQKGSPHGEMVGNFSDYLFFSFVTFTTVGYGDITPAGGLRWLAGIESLTGFVLITWTASFLYLEMTRFWPHDDQD